MGEAVVGLLLAALLLVLLLLPLLTLLLPLAAELEPPCGRRQFGRFGRRRCLG